VSLGVAVWIKVWIVVADGNYEFGGGSELSRREEEGVDLFGVVLAAWCEGGGGGDRCGVGALNLLNFSNVVGVELFILGASGVSRRRGLGTPDPFFQDSVWE
jgi:hypothetical protein